MQRIPLGPSGKTISNYCLGTMTYGRWTQEDDAHRQLDMALEAGIDVLDTAEMYPVPPDADWVGGTETVIGNWVAKNPAKRDQMTIATKISGLNGHFVRPGQPITAATFSAAFDGSCRRLQTDRIDLYQLHWPNRGSYHFRQNWTYDPSAQSKSDTLAHIAEVLHAAADLIAQGRLGAVGLSNESTWGTAQWLRVAEENDLPRVVSVQNEYSLLCRSYDTDLAELAVNENVTLLAFSPLAAGFLTGKYQNGAVPEGSRMSNGPEMGGRTTKRVFPAVAAYLDIAQRHGLDPVHMALAFTVARPFQVSTIFGATHLPQLERILAGLDVTLSDEVLADINAAHRAHPMPY